MAKNAEFTPVDSEEAANSLWYHAGDAVDSSTMGFSSQPPQSTKKSSEEGVYKYNR